MEEFSNKEKFGRNAKFKIEKMESSGFYFL